MNSATEITHHIINEMALRRERRASANLRRYIRPRRDHGRGGDIGAAAYDAEPKLDELLGDDTLRLVMAADGVQEGALRALLGAVKKAREDADPTRSPVATPVDGYLPRADARSLLRQRSVAIVDLSEPEGPPLSMTSPGRGKATIGAAHEPS